MAWNPAPEVAAARDAAKALGNAPMCVVVWLTDDGNVGMASYGRTKALCQEAKGLGDTLFDAAMKWGN